MHHTIRLANPSGGKAGRGRNKTSTVQVFYGNLLVKQYRFLMSSPESLIHATEKAKAYVELARKVLRI